MKIMGGIVAMSKTKLKNQIGEFQSKISKLQTKLEQYDIKEDIAEGRIVRVENIQIVQYIGKDKINMRERLEKTSTYDIKYKRKGKRIICEFGRAHVTGIGVARCNDNDEFDYYKGVLIAELRARSDFYKKLAESYSSKC